MTKPVEAGGVVVVVDVDVVVVVVVDVVVVVEVDVAVPGRHWLR